MLLRSSKEFLFVFAFLAPCIAIVVCYARSLKHLHRLPKTRGKTPEETAAAFLRLRQISLRQGKASGGPETPERLWSTCWPFDQAHLTESDQYRFQRSNIACVHPNMTKVKLLQLLRLCKAIYFPAWSLISESKLFYFWILIKRITYHNSDNVPEIYISKAVMIITLPTEID